MRIKIAFLVFLNMAKRKAFVFKVNIAALLEGGPCRMRKQRPDEDSYVCYLCAKRGGWLLCRRSHRIAAEIAPAARK